MESAHQASAAGVFEGVCEHQLQTVSHASWILPLMEEESSEINKQSSWVQGGHAAALSSAAELQGNPVSFHPIKRARSYVLDSLGLPANPSQAVCWLLLTSSINYSVPFMQIMFHGSDRDS